MKTRKDFEKAAALIRAMPKNERLPKVIEMSLFFKSNPRFDEEKFAVACGVSTPKENRHRKRIGETIKYELYFDLWGFTVPWIDTISDALHEFCDCNTDEAETYKCEACMAFRFTSTVKKRADKAKQIFCRLANLAEKTMKGNPSKVFYYHP